MHALSCPLYYRYHSPCFFSFSLSLSLSLVGLVITMCSCYILFMLYLYVMSMSLSLVITDWRTGQWATNDRSKTTWTWWDSTPTPRPSLRTHGVTKANGHNKPYHTRSTRRTSNCNDIRNTAIGSFILYSTDGTVTAYLLDSYVILYE